MSVHIGEPELSALVAVGQLGVIDPGEVENGRLHVMHVDGILGDVPSLFVRCTIGGSRFHSSAGHPRGEGAAKVIAPRIGLSGSALTERSGAEFAGEDDERIFQQFALFQIFH